MPSNLMMALNGQSAAHVAPVLSDIFLYHLHAALIGLVFVASHLFLSKRLRTVASKEDKIQGEGAVLLQAFNHLFLTLGLTSTLVLIDNNLLRAFGVIAALTLVRFRISLGDKGIGASALFSVVCGVACGLSEIRMAWLFLGFYLVAIAALTTLMAFRKTEISEPVTGELKSLPLADPLGSSSQSN